jgi:hypothetical protein
VVPEDRGENNSGRARFPRSRLFGVFFALAMVLLVLTLLVVIADVTEGPRDLGGPYIIAIKLSDKPETYFSLANPNSYVLQAISNSGHSVRLYSLSLSDPEAIELAQNYGGKNLEFQGSYYRITFGISIIDYPPSPSFYYPFLIIGWALWGICTVIAVVVVRVNKL